VPWAPVLPFAGSLTWALPVATCRRGSVRPGGHREPTPPPPTARLAARATNKSGQPLFSSLQQIHFVGAATFCRTAPASLSRMFRGYPLGRAECLAAQTPPVPG